MVHDCKDGIFSLACRKPRDKVHCYLLEGEGVISCQDAVCRSAQFMGNDFILLAGRTSLHVIGYPCIHPLPLAMLFHPTYCFIPSRVAGCGVVVGPCHQRLAFLCQWGCVRSYCINEFSVREYCNALVVVLSLVRSWRAR
jgi:hypothetical protein